MGFIHQQARAADFILSEANGQRSRENAVLEAVDTDQVAGTLLTKKASGSYAPYTGPGADEENPISADAVLYAGVPASGESQQIVIVARASEVASALLVGLDASARATLEKQGVIVRD
ncbi:head decoration protein [Pseudomonas sp. S 311-6]|uniref:head decoration protein n=1 Tax=Kerstersia similis TaxID=206505 RepID=UPI002097B99A|nr:head decoration protein [Pseudomonas sp. S 311-6]